VTQEERQKKKLQTDRGGGSDGGGLTAVGTEPSGDSEPEALELKPCTILIGGSLLSRFAINMLLAPVADVRSDSGDVSYIFDAIQIHRPTLVVFNLGDDHDRALELCNFINDKSARGIRFVVIASLHIATQFFRRYNNAGVSAICLTISGPEAVEKAVGHVLSGGKFFDTPLLNLISQRPYEIAPSANLSFGDLEILLRLEFFPGTICNELNLELESIEETLNALYKKIQVVTRSKAIEKLVSYGFVLLPNKDINARAADFEAEQSFAHTKCERVIARWLTSQLSASR
jgi:DNA-binding NarL/FixJ family response regulator